MLSAEVLLLRVLPLRSSTTVTPDSMLRSSSLALEVMFAPSLTVPPLSNALCSWLQLVTVEFAAEAVMVLVNSPDIMPAGAEPKASAKEALTARHLGRRAFMPFFICISSL